MDEGAALMPEGEMKYTYRASAYVVEEESDRRIDTPRVLCEWSYPGDRLENYLDAEVADRGVVGGVIHADVSKDGGLQILVDYWSPAALDDATVESLEQFTKAQLLDGIGEGGFEAVAEGRRVLIVPDLSRPVEVDRSEDGKAVKQPSPIAIAARDGNLSALSDALDNKAADVDSTHQGYTGLHFAILYGHADAAILLIEHGADVQRIDPTGNSPLDLCALSNSLSDEDSARVARALLSKGADPSRVGSTGRTPRGLAELRDKKATAEAIPSPN
jgi:hypothetical protein